MLDRIISICILIFLTFLGFGNAGCYKEKDYFALVDTSVLKVFSDSLTLPADGYSMLNIYASVPWDANDSLATITFRTTNGLFPDNGQNTITATALKSSNNVKVAQVSLRSSLVVDSARIFITNKAFGYKKVITINFTRAYADKFVFYANVLAVNPSNGKAGEIALNGLSTRQTGRPSIGDSVNVKGYDSLFNAIGSFRQYNNITDSLGNTSFTFVLGDSIANHTTSAYIGVLYIVGSTAKASSLQTLNDTIKIISSR